MSAAPMTNLPGQPLTPEDLRKLAEAGIPREVAEGAQLRRVDALTGGEIVGRNGGKNYAGIVFPYALPGNNHPRELRLRLDNPDIEDGREKNKYLCAHGCRNLVYFHPNTCPEWLDDTSVKIIITEGEKKTLALWALAWHELSDATDSPRWLSIGIPGVWNFRGTIGKTGGPDGGRRDVKGVIPDLERIKWEKRNVVILFDANVHSNEKVVWAREKLAAELRKRKSKVTFVDVPAEAGVNGVDDLVGSWGPGRVLEHIQKEAYDPRKKKAQVTREAGQEWLNNVIKSADGSPKSCVANAMFALREASEWKGVLAFNEFSWNVATVADTPWGGKPSDLTENDTRLFTEWLQQRRIFVSVEVACQAIATVAEEKRFHPVRDFLNALEWDGIPRVTKWLQDYLGVLPTDPPSQYSSAVGSCWLISAVARIFKPGCKADCCLILEGEQGLGKSRALRLLAQPWFTDEIADLGSKDSAMQARGTWIIEISELDGMARSASSRIKAFMSRSVDRFRPPYGRAVIDAPRQCVFAGSVNHSSYLRDETGARRFWPVQCTHIQLKELERDRDQLWAEAVMLYRQGRPWWLDSDKLIKAACAEQLARFEGDAWDEKIEAWTQGRSANVSISEILEHCLEKKKSEWSQSDQNRVARILRASGWERYKARDGEQREWRYRRGSH